MTEPPRSTGATAGQNRAAAPADAGGPDQRWVKPVLTRLGVAISRRRAYAASHPMVAQAEAALAQELLPHLAAGHTLALGVSDRDLLLNGAPLEGGGTVARDLADRLHRRGVGALTVQRGATAEALSALLGWITQGADATEQAAPVLPGISVGRIAYERLTLADEAAVQREADAIWRALVDVAMHEGHQGPDAGHAADRSTTDAVGEGIRAGVAHPAAAARVGFVLESVAAQVAQAPAAVREAVGERLQQVFARIGESSIDAVLKAVGSGRDQRRFLAAMCDVLPAQAVVGWLETAARATEQDVSQHLLRILAKLSAHADRAYGGMDAGDEATRLAFRDAARDLVHAWELNDPNPDEHTALLDQIAALGAADPSARPGGAGTMTESALAGTTREAARLVQMACELNVASADALAAVETLAANGHTAELLRWLDDAPGADAAAQLRDQLLAPAAIRATLLANPCDAAAARALLAQIDSTHIPLLLDALQAATSATARRLIYRRLRAEGPALYPELAWRLHERHAWYIIRNLLSLLRDIGGRAGQGESGVGIPDLTAFQSHPQPQVRLEALRLLARDAAACEAAIRQALNDSDPDVVTAAVEAAHAWANGEVPRRVDDLLADDLLRGDVTPTRGITAEAPAPRTRITLNRETATGLMRVVDDGRLDETTSVLAIACLRNAPGPTVRAWLLQLASIRTPVLRRLRVAPARPPVLAALTLLREQYADDATVARLLAVADRSTPPRGALPAAGARRDALGTRWAEEDS